MRRHPLLPFIEAYPAVAYARNIGWGEETISANCFNDGEWVAVIDGMMQICFAQSAYEAIDWAERRLFWKRCDDETFWDEFVAAKLDSLVAAGEMVSAFHLAEIRKVWRGRIEDEAAGSKRFQLR